MVLEVLQQKCQRFRGIRAHTKVDDAIMNRRINLNSIALRLVGDRLSGSSSAIFGDFTLRRANLDYLMARSLPLIFLNAAINIGRFSFPRDEIGVEL